MILDELAGYAHQRVREAKERVSLSALKEMTVDMPQGDFPLEKAVRKDGLSLICEVKKASPSKGVISSDFPYLDIAKDYESSGADCISCLTEPKWFLGSDRIFRDIRRNVTLPMLRKDFTIDEYQLFEAKQMGADGVLLICALLETATIEKFLQICANIGLSALVEAHDKREIAAAVAAGAGIIAVNNRNLKDFSVDRNNAMSLRQWVPKEILFVAESGIQKPADITAMNGYGIDAVLIGETIMRTKNKKELVRAFKEAAYGCEN